MSFQILNQPYDVRTSVGLTATFTYLVADPTGVITYQWLTNNHPIALASGFVPLPGAEFDGMWTIVGATGPSYTTRALIAADNGSQFICRVVDTLTTSLDIANRLSTEIVNQVYSSRCAVLQVH